MKKAKNKCGLSTANEATKKRVSKLGVKAKKVSKKKVAAKTKKSGSTRTCKAVNQKDKCIVYNANHKQKQVAELHAKKIKKRGGKFKILKTNKGYKIEYSFTKNKK